MFNQNIKPMLLKEISQPFNDLNYFYELKFDGIRALIYATSKNITIKSRQGINITFRYPELEEIKKIVGSHKVIFDGEIIALNSQGLPSFSTLQKRSHLSNNSQITSIISAIPIYYIVFDILYENHSLMNLPLVKRRKILNQYPNTDHFFKSPIYSNGLKLYKAVKKNNLEGIIAKAKDSLYYPGLRVDNWLKIKNFQKGSFIVHGYFFNTQKYSLLLGEYRNFKLYYIGKVSIMPNNPIFSKIKQIAPSKNQFLNYAGNATYIKPIFKIVVSYLQKTEEGKLRQPFIN